MEVVVAITVGTNISAVRALRSLDRTGSTLRTVFERLSSGARINRAADDAAGLAVSMSLSNRARVFSRSDRNVQDGISALNIADAALGEVSSVLTRMSELAAQASNSSLGRFQRMSLHQEYRALGDEIRRVSETTRFNGINLLSGTRSSDLGIELAVPDTPGNRAVTAASADGRYALEIQDTGVSNHINVYDRQTGVVTQIATGTGESTMDAQGNVFYSNESNLFRYDITTGTSTQLTNTGGATSFTGLTVSADGSRLAFTSTRQFTDGAAFASTAGGIGSSRLYAVDLSAPSNTLRRVAQASFPFLSSKILTLSSDGSKVFFVSNSNLTGNNADANYEIFGSDLSASNLTLRQVTDTTGGGGIGLMGATMKATNDGRVYFIDTRNYSGQNPSATRQIFIGNMNGSSVQQFGTYSFSSDPGAFTLSADESSIFLMARGNYSGENSGGSIQAFRIDLANGTTAQLTSFVETVNVTPTDGAFSGDGLTLYGVVYGDITSNAGYRLVDLAATQSVIDISTGNGTAGGIGVGFGALRSALEGISGQTLTSAAAARGALDALQRSIQNIAASRGTLGAGGARLEAAARVISAQVQEAKAAYSRIVDADVASESARLTQTQILQQAGAAVLAQANQQPALALRLLRIE